MSSRLERILCAPPKPLAPRTRESDSRPSPCRCRHPRRVSTIPRQRPRVAPVRFCFQPILVGQGRSGANSPYLATFSRHKDDGYLKAYGTFVYTRDEELRTAIARVRCPTLAVTSEADVGSTPEMAEAMARAIPGARCHIVNDGQKHMAPVEVADQYAQLLEDWIDA